MTSSVVCGVDRATPAEAVLLAARVAYRLGSRLVLFHAVVDVLRPRGTRSEDERERIRTTEIAAAEAMLRRIATAAGVAAEAECRAEVGDPVDWLLVVARDANAELIVVAPRGLHPLRTIVSGSVSAALARAASCPVLAVPPAALVVDASALEAPHLVAALNGVGVAHGPGNGPVARARHADQMPRDQAAAELGAIAGALAGSDGVDIACAGRHVVVPVPDRVELAVALEDGEGGGTLDIRLRW